MPQKNILASIIENWGGLSAQQKTAFAFSILILAILIGIVVMMASTPKYAQVFSNLSPADSNAIVTKLKEMKVNYRLTNGGSTIEVPSESIDETRMALAGEGTMPESGSPGFELFDKPQVGQSEFGERLNYRRALQGELARIICKLKSVRSASVMLAMPERRALAADEQPTSASILVTLREKTLNTNEVKAIVNLVSSSVEGLKPENVRVVDQFGNLLTEFADINGSGGSGDNRMRVQRSIESQIEQRVQSMLDRVLGPNKSMIRASAKINFNHKVVENEIYSPNKNSAGQVIGVLENERSTEETYGSSPTAGLGGGITSMLAPGGLLTGGSSNNKAGGYSRKEKNANYKISKRIEKEDIPPGQIEDVTISLMVDKTVKQKLEDLRANVAAVAGVEVAKVTASSVEFDQTFSKTEEEDAKKQDKMSMIMMGVKWGAGILVTVIFLVVLMSIYRATLAPVQGKYLPPAEINYAELTNNSQAYNQLPNFVTPDGQPTDVMQNMYTSLGIPQNQSRFSDDQLRELDPKRVATVIKGMLSEE